MHYPAPSRHLATAIAPLPVQIRGCWGPAGVPSSASRLGAGGDGKEGRRGDRVKDTRENILGWGEGPIRGLDSDPIRFQSPFLAVSGGGNGKLEREAHTLSRRCIVQFVSKCSNKYNNSIGETPSEV